MPKQVIKYLSLNTCLIFFFFNFHQRILENLTNFFFQFCIKLGKLSVKIISFNLKQNKSLF